MSSEHKGPASASEFEVDPQDLQHQSRLKSLRLVDSIRIGLTGLSLLCAITVLGTSADSIAVYNATHLPSEFNLPLWPDTFDLRPTIALVVGSVIVFLTSIVSLVFGKVQTVSILRSSPDQPRATLGAPGRPIGVSLSKPIVLISHS